MFNANKRIQEVIGSPGFLAGHPEHHHPRDGLLAAADCYAYAAGFVLGGSEPPRWPWPEREWRPRTVGSDLALAGAVCLVKGERLVNAANAANRFFTRYERRLYSHAYHRHWRVVQMLLDAQAQGILRSSTRGVPVPRSRRTSPTTRTRKGPGSQAPAGQPRLGAEERAWEVAYARGEFPEGVAVEVLPEGLRVAGVVLSLPPTLEDLRRFFGPSRIVAEPGSSLTGERHVFDAHGITFERYPDPAHALLEIRFEPPRYHWEPTGRFLGEFWLGGHRLLPGMPARRVRALKLAVPEYGFCTRGQDTYPTVWSAWTEHYQLDLYFRPMSPRAKADDYHGLAAAILYYGPGFIGPAPEPSDSGWDGEDWPVIAVEFPPLLDGH